MKEKRKDLMRTERKERQLYEWKCDRERMEKKAVMMDKSERREEGNI